MRSLSLNARLAALALLLASAALAAGLTGRPCEGVTGPITFKELARRRMGVRNPEGRIRTFTVDDAAMPHWNEEFQVSQRVSVTCKDLGDERRPLATSIKPAPADPDAKP